MVELQHDSPTCSLDSLFVSFYSTSRFFTTSMAARRGPWAPGRLENGPSGLFEDEPENEDEPESNDGDASLLDKPETIKR